MFILFAKQARDGGRDGGWRDDRADSNFGRDGRREDDRRGSDFGRDGPPSRGGGRPMGPANRIFAGGMRSQRPANMPVTPEMIREVFSRFGRIVDMRAGAYLVLNRRFRS